MLAAIVEYRGQVLLARNAWPAKMFALITGFMEAGETPQEGIAREVKEETNLDVQSLALVGVYELPAHEPGHHRLSRRVQGEECGCRPSWWTGVVRPARPQVLARRHRLRAGRLAAHTRAGTSRCSSPEENAERRGLD